jgi:hypothetical protein
MLMQPQSSDKQFDFMLKNNQPAKSGGGLLKLPKPVMIGLAVILGIILLIAVSSVLSGRKNGATQPIVDSVARGQEIIRVTTAVQTLGLHDPSINALSTTVLAVLTSDHRQLVQYLAANNVKLTKVQASVYTDKTVDDQMQTALQSNNLDQTYTTYLQQNIKTICRLPIKLRRDQRARIF